MYRMDFDCKTLLLLFVFWVPTDAMFKSCGLIIVLHGKTITSKMAWGHKGVWDKLACAVACMNDPYCLTFIYFPSKKKCMGYPRTLDSYMDNVTYVQDGSSIIVRTCRGGIGEKCNRNDECSFRDSVCFVGVCLCKPGLYYSPRHNGCLKECAEYGDYMDAYNGASILEHNDKIIMSQTLTRCFELCTEEKSFTCLTADYYKSGWCHLSRSGYLDVTKAEREQGFADWVMAQRRCK